MDTGIFSIALNAILTGGFLFQMYTIKALRLKANAEAKGASASAESIELDNVDKVIKMWREMAEKLNTELKESRENYLEVARQVDQLRKEVNKLTLASNKILKLLDKITHENLETVVKQIKNEINGKVA